MALGHQPMNCFEWQNRSSDYLDGTLIGALQQEADGHLERCEACRERHKHFRQILAVLESRPRAALPIPVRGEPMTAALPRLDAAQLGKSRWQLVPWYVRTAIEATTIVLLILAGISAGPKLRVLYERGIERNLSELNQAFSDVFEPEAGNGTAELNLPLARGKAGDAVSGDTAADEFVSDEEDTAENEPGTTTAIDQSDVRVGNSEIWRFIVKTDSPHRFRAKIVSILTGLKVAPTTPGLGGIEAPGGIQFDLLLPKGIVPGLKRQLQGIAPPAPEGQANSPMTETFTWFKNKSRRPIPEGRTRVVIWLSQM
ncbi:MAG: hypothetical protein NDJ90_15115 [Oligoflexia bacterium]|nr:hypothetical protein [Oligoflexia bacterium]